MGVESDQQARPWVAKEFHDVYCDSAEETRKLMEACIAYRNVYLVSIQAQEISGKSTDC